MEVHYKNLDTGDIIVTEVTQYSYIRDTNARMKKDGYVLYRIPSEETRSSRDAWGIIYNEGLGYAVTSYCDHTIFKDEKMRELWMNAKMALTALEEYSDLFENEINED